MGASKGFSVAVVVAIASTTVATVEPVVRSSPREIDTLRGCGGWAGHWYCHANDRTWEVISGLDDSNQPWPRMLSGCSSNGPDSKNIKCTGNGLNISLEEKVDSDDDHDDDDHDDDDDDDDDDQHENHNHDDQHHDQHHDPSITSSSTISTTLTTSKSVSVSGDATTTSTASITSTTTLATSPSARGSDAATTTASQSSPSTGAASVAQVFGVSSAAAAFVALFLPW